MKITFSLGQAIVQIDRLIKAVELGQEGYAEIGDMLLASIEARFAAEGKPKWKALAPSTLANRRRKGRGFTILTDSGNLRRSMRKYVSQNRVTVGTDVLYAEYPQKVRPYMYFSREDLLGIEAIVKRRVEGAVR